MWDEAYATGEYLREWDYAHPSQELVAFVASANLSKDSIVLDVGCGAGREAIFLAQCGASVIGVDLSSVAIGIARRRAKAARVRVQWCVADALQLPLAPASIDCVTDRGCFHIIPQKNRRRFGQEIGRVLRPGGCLLLRGAVKRGRRFGGVTRQEIDRCFPRELFSRGPVLPIQLVADSGTLKANIVVARRR